MITIPNEGHNPQSELNTSNLQGNSNDQSRDQSSEGSVVINRDEWQMVPLNTEAIDQLQLNEADIAQARESLSSDRHFDALNKILLSVLSHGN